MFDNIAIASDILTSFKDLDLNNISLIDLHQIIHLPDIDFNKFTPEFLKSRFNWEDLYTVYKVITNSTSCMYANNPAMLQSAVSIIDVAWMTKCQDVFGENWLEAVKETKTYKFYNHQ